MPDRSYVPALGFHALTRLYDPFVALTLREKAIRGRLIEQARIAPGHDVLDVGCGTGTLALMIKTRQPEARVVGLDGDPAVLALARRKLERAGADVRLVEGLADDAKHFPAGSFDRIVTSFVLHHLTAPQKSAALAAMRRWLRPGGELHVIDFDGPGSGVIGFVLRTLGALHGGGHAHEHGASVSELAREVGFSRADETARVATPFGSAAYWRATP